MTPKVHILLEIIPLGEHVGDEWMELGGESGLPGDRNGEFASTK